MTDQPIPLDTEAPEWMRPHDAYTDCLEGGHKGYQAACWDCGWRGPEHLRGDEEMGTPESRAHKRNAHNDSVEHRESAPHVLDRSKESVAALARALDSSQARAEELAELVEQESQMKAVFAQEAREAEARAEEAEARLRSALETRAVWQANYGLERTRADTSEQERDHATQEVERLRRAIEKHRREVCRASDRALYAALNPNPTPEDEDG